MANSESRKSAPQSSTAVCEAIRGRLNELRKRFPQSEIARRTNTPLTNVHRYMNTGRIPAEFCTALVEALEVNPAWLLLGEGGELLSDVSANSAETGRGLLALIESMNAVSRLRLGALAGKQDQKLLRELSDAFSANESLRKKLNAQSLPVFTDLLNEGERQVGELNLERAASVLESAREVGRFCDDEELHTRFMMVQANLEYQRGALENSLKLSRRVFAQSLRAGALEREQDLRFAMNLALSLKETGRHLESLRVTRAALALAQDHMGDTRAYAELELFRGYLEVEIGQAQLGLTRIQKVWPRLSQPDGGSGNFATIIHLRALLVCGLISFKDARAFGTPGPGSTRQLVRWACWLEDASELRDVCRSHIGKEPTQIPPHEYDAARAKLLLKALEGKVKPGEFAAMAEKHPPIVASQAVREIVLASHEGQFAMLIGQPKRVAVAGKRFEKLCAALPADIYVPIDLRALHYRNVLRLEGKPAEYATPTKVQEARRFFEQQVAGGYGCYAHLARQ